MAKIVFDVPDEFRGLVETWRETLDSMKATLDRTGGGKALPLLPYSRSSFETVAHLVGALAVADHQDIEDALIDAYVVPEEARSVSVSLDRVSVPIEEPRDRPVGRPRKGAPKKPVARNFRMAYCGTVSVHDENGEALHTIRYGAMPDGDVIGLRDRLVNDVVTLAQQAARDEAPVAL